MYGNGDQELVPQYWWDSYYQARPIAYEERLIGFKDVFDRFLSRGGICFEVGFYPGNYLIYLGKKFGYVVEGIDRTCFDELKVKAHFEKHGVKVGKLIRGDFLSWRPNRTYDVVLSMGFIEHFINWREVLRKHVFLVKPGGKLIITIPNMRGFQHFLYWFLDRDKLNMHHLEVMDPTLIKKELELLRMKVILSSYYRTFDFYGEPKDRLRQWIVRKLLRLAEVVNARIRFPTKLFSPNIVVVSEKPQT